MATALAIPQEKAIDLLEALGNEDAGEASVSKLNNLLKEVKGEHDEDEEYDLSKAQKKLYSELLKAKKFSVVADEEEEDDEEEKPKKGKKAPKASANGKAGKKKAKKGTKKREPAEMDEFGCREGTGAAAINAAIIRSPKGISVEKLKEKVSESTPARIMSHLRWLVAGKKVRVKEGKVTKR